MKKKLSAKKNEIIGIDLFCGVGGMSLGFQQAGIKVVAAVDIDKINVEYHKKNFPDTVAIQADLSKISGAEIRKQAKLQGKKIDVVFGGPPCQSFSLMGKRKTDDPRGDLLTHFARIVNELDPRYFVMENVQGLTLGKAKLKLDAFVKEMEKFGYDVAVPQVLNASDYGVPQQRKRVFVLGAKKGLKLPSYPEPPSFKGKNKKPTVWDAIGDLNVIENANGSLKNGVYSGKLGKASPYAKKLLTKSNLPLTGNLRSVHTKLTIKRFEATDQGSYEKVSRFHRLEKNGFSNTLRAGTGPDHGSYMAARPIHPQFARCITVREAARLHSYPDWVEFHPTNWHGFRQVGNSVPPLLAKVIGAKLTRQTEQNL